MTEEAEKYGFEYRHFRPHVLALPDSKAYKCGGYMRGVTQWKPRDQGGATLCFVFNNDDEIVAWGLTLCCMKDNFCYRHGRIVSKGRALAALKGTEPKYYNGYKLCGITDDVSLFRSTEVFFVPAQRH